MGFPFEVLKVYGEPPVIGFSWRHWALFDGVFNNNKGNNQIIEIYGFATAQVKMPKNKDERIMVQDLVVYYDMDKFLAELNGTPYTAVPDAMYIN